MDANYDSGSDIPEMTFKVGIAGKQDKSFFDAFSKDTRTEELFSCCDVSIDVAKNEFRLISERSNDGIEKFRQLNEVCTNIERFISEDVTNPRTHNLKDIRAEFAAMGMNMSGAAFDKIPAKPAGPFAEFVAKVKAAAFGAAEAEGPIQASE
jgi:hypothetical protein